MLGALRKPSFIWLMKNSRNKCVQIKPGGFSFLITIRLLERFDVWYRLLRLLFSYLKEFATAIASHLRARPLIQALLEPCREASYAELVFEDKEGTCSPDEHIENLHVYRTKNASLRFLRTATSLKYRDYGFSSLVCLRTCRCI